MKSAPGAFPNSGAPAAGAGRPAAAAAAIRSGASAIPAPHGPEAARHQAERIPGLLASLGFPDDRASRIALSALMGEGLGLDRERLRQVRLAMARSPGGAGQGDALAARLASRALAAGLDPAGPAMERVLGLCSRDGDGQGGGEGGTGADPGRQPGGGSGRQPGRDADDPDTGPSEPGEGGGQGDGAGHQAATSAVALDLPPDRLVAGLARAFPAFLASAMADPDLAAMAAPGQNGKAWLHVPFSLSLDDVAFRGYFRILYDRDARRAERLVAEIRSGGRRRVVELGPGRGRPRIRFHSDDADERDRFRGELFPEALTAGLGEQASAELDAYGGYDGETD